MAAAHIRHCPHCLGVGKVGYALRRRCGRCSGRGWVRRRPADVITRAVDILLHPEKEEERR